MDISERQLAVDKLNYSALQLGPGEQGQSASRHGLGLGASEVVGKAWLGHDPKVSIWPSIDGSRKGGF